MDVPAIGAAPDAADHGRSLRLLRARWRTASMAAGWRFPNDWALPEVDTVCAAVVKTGSVEAALAALARARAGAGAGLEETLSDLAALHAVLEQPDGADGFVAPDVDATPARLLRQTASAWAAAAVDQLATVEVVDSLTGLATAAYLRTRLGELYREAARGGARVSDAHTLVVVTMDFSRAGGWSRLTGMILAADALRYAFDGGETLAVAGPSTVIALLGRDGGIATRTVTLRRALTERLATDRDLRELGSPRIRLVRLPATHDAACELLTRLRGA